MKPNPQKRNNNFKMSRLNFVGTMGRNAEKRDILIINGTYGQPKLLFNNNLYLKVIKKKIKLLKVF